MGKASRTKVESSRREKIAAQQAAARRAEQRRRILIAGGSIIVVLVVVVVFVVLKLTGSSKSGTDTSSNGPTGSALSSLISTTTSVPASTLNAVGAGSGILSKPQTITGTALTENGKPEVLYMGAEYCPYCAAERWAMVVALSRFGTFSGLATTHSAKVNGAGQNEPYPDTATWTFRDTTFTSQYLTFTPVETYTNIPDHSNGGYTALQTPTTAEQALLTKYDVPPLVPSGSQGAIPFLDFGNQYAIGGAGYLPSVLAGLTWAQIAADLSNPNSSVAKPVLGTANYITAAICKITGNAPATVCTSTIQSLESQI
jgi:Domain of unknown function (DUF929)